MQVIKKNILDVEHGYIIHQTNCLGAVGGLAKDLRYKFPHWYPKYKKLCDKHNPIDLLGSLHLFESKNITIGCAFGQLNFGYDKTYTDYAALTIISEHLKKLKDKPIYLPYKIGCGMARGKWEIVEPIFRDVEGFWCKVD